MNNIEKRLLVNELTNNELIGISGGEGSLQKFFGWLGGKVGDMLSCYDNYDHQAELEAMPKNGTY